MTMDADSFPTGSPEAARRVLSLRLTFRVPQYVQVAYGRGQYRCGTRIEHCLLSDVVDEERFTARYARNVSRLAMEFRLQSAETLARKFGVQVAQLVYTGAATAWHEPGERVHPGRWE